MASGLQIELFGPMRVLVDGEPLPHVRSRKAHWLLALLVLREGRPASREWIASTLWPDVDLTTAYANLRPVVSELRRALGAEGKRVVSECRTTLACRVEGVEIDTLAFAAAIQAGDFNRAAELHKRPLLEGCSEEWAVQERQLREHECLSALRQAADAAFGSGDYVRAVELCHRSIVLDPFRDAARRTMMKSLAASGDIQGALQVYREYAHLLGRELGMVPEPATAELYGQLRADMRSAVAKPRAERAIENNVPADLSPLIGRDDERLDVMALIRRNRFVSLTGVGGIGKTRLASAVALDLLNEFPDGVWFVALDALNDGSRVASTVAAALGQSSAGALFEWLLKRNVLLILDNCEHVIPEVTDLSEQILRQCPYTKILTTSREALATAWEVAWEVPPLAFPDFSSLPAGRATRLRVVLSYESVRLFVERSRAVQAGFDIDDENLASVVEICAAVEGMPLAIELAAARMRSLAPSGIASRLRDHHLDLLGRKNGRAQDRQQSLRATLEWSFALLSEVERIAFNRLSIFAGGWTLEAAEEVLACDAIPSDEVGRILDRLTERSLIVFDIQAKRFRFLETVRQFAREKLQEAGDGDVAVRHLRWCVSWALGHEAETPSPPPSEWIDELKAEMPNLRVAFRTSSEDPASAVIIAGCIRRLLLPAGFLEEGYRLITAALERDRGDPTIERAKALLGAASLAFDIPTREAGSAYASESLEIFRKCHAMDGVAESLACLAASAVHLDRMQEARERYVESIQAARELDHPALLAEILHDFAVYLTLVSDKQAERKALEECLAIWRNLGVTIRRAWPLRCLAILEWDSGNWEQARTYADEAFELVANTPDLVSLGSSLELSGHMALELFENERAESLFQEALELFRKLDDWLGVSKILGHLALLRYSQGRLDEAAELAEESLKRCRERGEVRGTFRAADALSAVALARNLEIDARSICADRVSRYLETDFFKGAVLLAERLAQCALHRGEATVAAEMLGASNAARLRIQSKQSPRRAQEFGKIESGIRKQIGEQEFEVRYRAGHSMQLSEVALREPVSCWRRAPARKRRAISTVLLPWCRAEVSTVSPGNSLPFALANDAPYGLPLANWIGSVYPGGTMTMPQW